MPSTNIERKIFILQLRAALHIYMRTATLYDSPPSKHHLTINRHSQIRDELCETIMAEAIPLPLTLTLRTGLRAGA